MKNEKKCYNSFSCIFSVLVIVFILGSITWDIFVTKPSMRNSIDEIKQEIKEIKTKINPNIVIELPNDTLVYNESLTANDTAK